MYIKYTKTYELDLKVELFDDNRCGYCPFYHSGHSNRCSYLQKDLPLVVDEGGGYIGRHPNCPLKLAKDQVNSPT